MNGIPLTHNVFAFIQARTTSTRLPNKVLKSFIGEKCILDFLIERVEKVLPKTSIALLVPKDDKALVNYAKNKGLLCFEGSELNVRERFIQAAKIWNANWILRLTADNPFVDIEHLQYLIEATRFTSYDLISFSDLPIGMGGEIFSMKALEKEPSSGITLEHEEHVSLHIKQFPSEYSVLRLKPFILDSSNSSKIRLTVDEELDFLTCQEIYLEFKQNHFGVNDILALYEKKPQIFEKNQTVKQVSFFTSNFKKNTQKKILIIHAPIQEHGSAHFRRMSLLKIYLESIGFQVDMLNHLENFSNDSSYRTCILDYRDKNLPAQAQSRKWIKIDNFSPKEGEETYFYTLPHPKLNFQNYEDSFLVPLSYFLVQANPKREGVLVYVGGVKESELNYLASWMVENFPNQKIIFVGKEFSHPTIKSFQNLPSFQFYELMAHSESFLSYFGQSLLEALHLGCKCFSFSISRYHTELALFLEEKLSIPFLGELKEKNFKFKSHSTLQNQKKNFTGFEKLIQLIQEFFKLK